LLITDIKVILLPNISKEEEVVCAGARSMLSNQQSRSGSKKGSHISA